MNKINKLLKPIDIALTKVLDNKFVSLFLKVFLVLYTSLMVPKLPKKLLVILNHTASRIIIAAIIVILATKDVTLGILSSVAFIMTIEFASHLNLFEDFTAAKTATSVLENEQAKIEEEEKKAIQNVQNIREKKKEIINAKKSMEKLHMLNTKETANPNLTVDNIVNAANNNSNNIMNDVETSTGSNDFVTGLGDNDFATGSGDNDSSINDTGNVNMDMNTDLNSVGVDMSITTANPNMGNDSTINMNMDLPTSTTLNTNQGDTIINKINELSSVNEMFVGNRRNDIRLLETFKNAQRAKDSGIIDEKEFSEILKYEEERLKN